MKLLITQVSNGFLLEIDNPELVSVYGSSDTLLSFLSDFLKNNKGDY